MYCCCQGGVLKSQLVSDSDLPFVSYCHWYFGTITSDIVLEIGVMKVCMWAQAEGFGFFVCPQWQADADVSRGRIILSWPFSAQKNCNHSLRPIRPLIWLICCESWSCMCSNFHSCSYRQIYWQYLLVLHTEGQDWFANCDKNAFHLKNRSFVVQIFSKKTNRGPI